VAAGEPLSHCQEDIRFKGHAVECRINAESPIDFSPAPGQVTEYHPPGGGGVRVDSALYAGYRVPPFYDSMIGKLIVYGLSRDECLMRLKRSLEEFVIGGIEHPTATTTTSYQQGHRFATNTIQVVEGSDLMTRLTSSDWKTSLIESLDKDVSVSSEYKDLGVFGETFLRIKFTTCSSQMPSSSSVM
jgi:acetyl/propionyl-CoA carboxylase alpha subunit